MTDGIGNVSTGVISPGPRYSQSKYIRHKTECRVCDSCPSPCRDPGFLNTALTLYTEDSTLFFRFWWRLPPFLTNRLIRTYYPTSHKNDHHLDLSLSRLELKIRRGSHYNSRHSWQTIGFPTPRIGTNIFLSYPLQTFLWLRTQSWVWWLINPYLGL